MFRKKEQNIQSHKRFYYYSPSKLKLIPIKNFITKAIISLSLFTLFAVTFSIYFSSLLFSGDGNLVIKNQNEILKNEYEEELELLKENYVKLANEFDKLIQTSNDLRLAVNLQTINSDELKYGIGGSNFEKSKLNASIAGNDQLTDIYDLVNSIDTKLKFEKVNYKEIHDKYTDNKDLFEKIPAIKPVNSSYGDRFGMRYHPILKRRRMHHGLDFLSNTGEEVFSPGSGIVTYVGRKGGYGKIIRINHGFGYETLYAHLSKYKVKKGQRVKRGELIALSGNSGSLSTGPHLHYEVRHKGVSLNPRNFIFDDIRLFDKSF